MPEQDTMGFTEMAMGHMDDAPVYNNEDDKRLLVRFTNEPVQDPDKSRVEGRPIFKDCPHITIMKPGSRDSIIRPVRDTDKIRFSQQWQMFEKGQEMSLEGTPLEAWPGITRSLVEELKYMNVFTVEQLVAMPDVHAQNVMGYSLLKRRAQAFLDAAAGTAPVEAMSAEIEELKAANKELTNQVAALIEKLEDNDADREIPDSSTAD